MKRFMLFIAMVGFVATSCSKTIVKDEVETAISFSTESSKLTRAIVQGDVYDDAQPFGVVAYAHQGGVSDKLMDTVQVAKTGNDWKSKVGKYYWPNDPTTTIDFYAYSPAINLENASLVPNQQMTVDNFAQADNGAMSFEAYTHINMYVDFMVATPVKGATYVNPDGDANTETASGKEGIVPVVFNHQMSQILFKVTTDVDYGSGIKFTLKSITLKNIKDKADFDHSYADDDTQDQEQYDDSHVGIWSNQAFSDQNNKRVYPIFPATTNLGAPSDEREVEGNIVYVQNVNTADNVFTTTGVTMIPQTMEQCSRPYVAGADNIAEERTAQMFEIVYSISGTGVADETVTKHIPFWPSDADINKQGQNYSVVHWGPNKRITYVVKIGLNEVKFEPSVADWENTAGNTYTFKQ